MIKTKDLPALKDRLRTLLRDELNLARFREDEDGNFHFRYERMSLKAVFDVDDPAFVWIAHFGFYWVNGADPAVLARADRSISEVNYRIKSVKLSRRPEPDKDGDYPVTASISFLAEDATSHDGWTLERYLDMIKLGTNRFRELFERERELVECQPAASVVTH